MQPGIIYALHLYPALRQAQQRRCGETTEAQISLQWIALCRVEIDRGKLAVQLLGQIKTLAGLQVGCSHALDRIRHFGEVLGGSSARGNTDDDDFRCVRLRPCSGARQPGSTAEGKPERTNGMAKCGTAKHRTYSGYSGVELRAMLKS